MSETNARYLIKQVWRQKGDALFDRIPFKEENKASELSQTTRPVLLLETKTNGGSGAVFAIGRVTEPVVAEEAIEYPNGEFMYHVPFAYDFVLEDKKNGVTRDELQELAGQKFAPQARGGLYEIEQGVYDQLVALLQERAGGQAISNTVTTEQAPAAQELPEAPKKAAPAAATSSLQDSLRQAVQTLQERPELRLLVEEGKFSTYPAVLLEMGGDLVALQQTISEYVASAGHASVEQAAQEVAATAQTGAPAFANVIQLVQQMVSEGKYDSVQIPTLQKSFYRGGNLPHPYTAIELQGKNGHHVLGANGTLYTIEGKQVQHFLGL